VKTEQSGSHLQLSVNRKSCLTLSDSVVIIGTDPQWL